MKYALLLLCLARLAQAAPAPPVPAALDVAGLHLSLDDDARQLIQQRADGLMRHQPSFQARVDLADASFPIIDRILQKEGVPLDFRYLALQESALLGDAESNHGAVGYWQLKRETATGLGLRVDETVDERRHLVASTRAAARYLLRSQATTQNWLLALLSYQTGLGGVRAYQLPTDAGATQMNISAATHPYVLMFLAHKLVFEPACDLNPTPPLRLREFPAAPGQTLAEQAAALATDPAGLLRHNRWFLHPDRPVPSDDGPYTLLVPVFSATGGAQNAALAGHQATGSRGQLITPPAASARDARRVRINNLDALIALPGETADDLARRGGVRPIQLRRDNDLRAFDAIVPGRPYFLEKKRDEATTDYHVVQPGEDLAAVSQQYGIRRSAIRRKNRFSFNEDLRPGRVLWLRHTRPREVAIEYRNPAEAVALERRASGQQPIPASAATVPRRPAALPPATPAMPPPPAEVATAEAAAAELPTPAPQPPAAPVAEVSQPAPAEPAQPVPTAPAPVAPAPVVTERPTSPASAPAVVYTRPARPAAPAAVPTAAVPTAAVPTSLPPAPAATPTEARAPVPASGFYRVRARETVYGLARRYGLSPADLLTWNSLQASASLQLGQLLRLRAPTAAAGDVSGAAAPALPPTHTVGAGETLYSIARRYGRTVAELQQLNAKLSADVRIGEVLRVAAP
ncbi:LysM peptidoglycan-binding domain-containing protein [uncultured Hymenobacter sp.]|uniref:LysM peptidoglycan-binding domain-containing protein n=1 Tax=uncultured Hymenobacter sp. TaxID=170016 RepID=UPI0035CC914D